MSRGTKIPYAAEHRGQTYTQLKVRQSFDNNTFKLRFSTVLLLGDEGVECKIYDSQTNNGEFNRKSGFIESPLLNALLNELHDQIVAEEKIPKGTIKSIRVGIITLFIDFHEGHVEFDVVDRISRLVKDQITNLVNL